MAKRSCPVVRLSAWFCLLAGRQPQPCKPLGMAILAEQERRDTASGLRHDLGKFHSDFRRGHTTGRTQPLPGFGPRPAGMSRAAQAAFSAFNGGSGGASYR